eukprot:scaffold227_cov165-Amphora_coffeaeformis.AAC.1
MHVEARVTIVRQLSLVVNGKLDLRSGRQCQLSGIRIDGPGNLLGGKSVEFTNVEDVSTKMSPWRKHT